MGRSVAAADLAVENTEGLGYLLAQQLAGASEHVVGVQPKLAARVRLPAADASSRTDPHDARSVAIVGLRSAGLRRVVVEDHAAVMRVWIRRRRHLSRLRTKVVNQLHALLCEVAPGGLAREISARRAAVLLETVHPTSAADQARVELAAEILDDLRRVDAAAGAAQAADRRGAGVQDIGNRHRRCRQHRRGARWSV